ncbi:hypothetical protein ATI61_1176 [Archangium gephyra]|uniref:DUF4148 domain-containing protein n=1 Tax=Archangium gephyra TaxID=48 RepID=A0AAC8Q807_9BACT|nr:hypothetical protein [Archangium gephyra]AKJ02615.1 Hypothetical protein AA314_04241 [Archangium gephyra]REG23163.1 hypothetical protein ATI61_1176 [Archangium gephyra]
MSRRLSVLLLSTWLMTPNLVLAEDLTPEQLARIRRAEKAAVDKVNAAHGNKKSSELSTDERRQMIREQQEAVRKVMDENGVSPKDYARQSARMGRKQNEQVAAEEKALEAKEKAAGAAKPPHEKEPGEIQVQEGFSEENPVMLDEQEGASPVVEHGLPVGEEAPSEPSVEE